MNIKTTTWGEIFGPIVVVVVLLGIMAGFNQCANWVDAKLDERLQKHRQMNQENLERTILDILEKSKR